MKPIVFEVPIRTVPGMNAREHYMVRARRVKSERRATAYRMPPEAKQLGPLLVVTLTRKSKGKLDTDNLAGACKGVRDQVACALGIDDRSPLIRWEYLQAHGESAVGVRIELVAS